MTNIKLFLKSLLVFCLFFMASGFVSGQVLAAPRLYFEPATLTTTKDSDFQINLLIDVESKSAFGADAVVNFPPGDITVKSVTNGGFFSDFSYAPSLGKLEIHGFFSTLYSSKSGSGNFAVLTLNTNKDSGSGILNMTCSGSGADTQILDTNGQNILACSSLNQLSLTYSGATVPNPTPNSCGGTCGSNYNCNSGLFCYQGFCRNPFCSSDTSCECKATPTPSPTPKGTAKPLVSPTPPVVPLTKFTPFPTATPSGVPTPTETPETEQGSTLKSIALWVGLGVLGAAAAVIIIKILKRRKGPPKIIPPSGTTIDKDNPIKTYPVSPPFPPPSQT